MIALLFDIFWMSLAHWVYILVLQEKAFEQVEHQHLWQMLKAFGFSPGFTAKIQVLHRELRVYKK